MAHNNRCFNSAGIGRKKRLARGINIIVFNPNLMTPTQSAAKLIHSTASVEMEGWKREKKAQTELDLKLV